MFLIFHIFLIINSSLCVLNTSIHLYVFRLSLLSFAIFRTKWSKVLLAWLLMMVIYIFPEAGLVLFMSIYHWVRLIYYRTCIRLLRYFCLYLFQSKHSHFQIKLLSQFVSKYSLTKKARYLSS